MIIFVNPRATRPSNRRFPLSVMALAAALPEGTAWHIVDGNLPGTDVVRDVSSLARTAAGSRDPVRAIAMTVMPGPQLLEAVPQARALRQLHPDVPIVWGGYFPSLYPGPVIDAPYIDYAIRGQGEHTFNELLDVIGGTRSPESVAGLVYRSNGERRINPERPWTGPNELPPLPYERIPVGEYLRPTFLGRRCGVYQASIGCPYGCSFCGVISVFGSREKVEAPERTARQLAWLGRKHGWDGVRFGVY
jgi:radical SAM superfamily enzyme YgiQ (UPF0313 family)